MKNWLNEMKDIKEKANCAYHSPLPLKKQRVTARAERPGKCKVFTEEEIFLFKLRMYKYPPTALI